MNSHAAPAWSYEVRRNWGWFLALGLIEIALGSAAILFAWVATLASVLAFGWLLVIAGVVEAVAAIGGRRQSGFFLHLLSGVLNLVVGLLVVTRPGVAAATLTLLLAAFFLVAGLARIGVALAVPSPHRGWELLGGAITALLGGLIGADWPESALWVIGTFVGIDLLFRGWAWVMLGVAIRQPGAPAERAGGDLPRVGGATI